MIRSYKDLIVWQKSMDLVESIYRITEKLPSKENFGLISQMRRAAVSIPSNIAEGYGRQSRGSYVQFLSIARGSLLELETQIELCVRLKYFKQIDSEKILSDILEISKMLTSLISKIGSVK
ncbi:MAG: four helix bundle protein [Ignavibacteriaceae bacterium]|jgi:four helix bundle protein|nr:four helix bundle protein [Ignavibacteriaceae bacterium]